MGEVAAGHDAAAGGDAGALDEAEGRVHVVAHQLRRFAGLKCSMDYVLPVICSQKKN